MSARSTVSVSAPESTHEDPFARAYHRVRARAAALERGGLLVFNADVPYAVGIALAAIPRIAPLRSRMVTLSDFDIAHYDELDTHAMALAYCHGCCLAHKEPVADLTALYDDAFALRNKLELDARALAARGLLDKKAVQVIGSGIGYSNVANSLLALSAAFRDGAGRIEAKTAVEASELAQATSFAQQLLLGIGQREQPVSSADFEPTLERQRVFTLFNRSYDQVRRAMTYLRWDDGDADTFAPSLYARHTGSSAHSAADPATPAAPAAPAEPTTNSTLEALTKGPGSRPVPQDDPFKR